MTKIAVRQTILDLVVVLDFSLLASYVFLLRAEATAADTMPFRRLMGYTLWLIPLLASV